MAFSDWHIIGTVAIRKGAGREIIVTVGKFATIQEAIQDWEKREKARQTIELNELGRIVDGAMTRLQLRTPPPSGRSPDAGETRRTGQAKPAYASSSSAEMSADKVTVTPS